MHERGSHGSRGCVAPEGAARLGLPASAAGTVVVVEVGVWLDATPVVVGEAPGPEVVGDGLVGALTDTLEPITRTTSALADDGQRMEPTSMVLEVSPGPGPDVLLLSNPGSYPKTASPDIDDWTRRASSSSAGLA